MTCALGTVAVASEATVTVVLKAPNKAGAVVALFASVVAEPTDPASGNNTAQQQTAVVK